MSKDTLKKEILEEFENHSLETGRKCKSWLDHHPQWDGNYYTCGICGLEFRNIEQVKDLLDHTIDRVREEVLEMIKFDKGDLPAFPPLMEKLETPKGLLDFALMIIKAKINQKYEK